MPGGQYTNLKSQVESLGLGHQFEDVKEMYVKVNHMLGDIVKVTPSSKMVGDLAIFMVQNNLTPENIVQRGAALAFPDSVVSYFKGMMGQPAWGFPKDLQKVVLKGEEPITCRPGLLLDPVDFDQLKKEVSEFRDDAERKDLISYAMYPKVYKDFCRHRKEFGYITRMQPRLLQRHGPRRDEQDQHRGRQDPRHQVSGSGRPQQRRYDQRPVRAQRHAP